MPGLVAISAPDCNNIMTQIEKDILEILSDECYTTKKSLMERAKRSKTSMEEALRTLDGADLIDKIYVRTSTSNRQEIAFMKLAE